MAIKAFRQLGKAGIYGVFSASAVLAMSCGSPVSSNSELDITNGTEISVDDYPAVVLLLVEHGPNHKICTGTFINDHQLLTAAHCITHLPNRMPGIYYAEPAANKNGQSYNIRAQARRYVVHPLYEGKSQPEIHRHDLAIVDFPMSTAPASVKISTVSPRADSSVTLVGFGDEYSYLDSSGVQSGEGAGIKRQGTNKVQSLSDGLLSFAGLPGPNHYLGLGQWVATGTGDSGGPLFYQDKLAGVTSGGQLERNSSGELVAYAYYVDLTHDENLKFIQSHVW